MDNNFILYSKLLYKMGHYFSDIQYKKRWICQLGSFPCDGDEQQRGRRHAEAFPVLLHEVLRGGQGSA